MKRDALAHPKMLDLASRLDCSRAQAIGIMTLLFDFAATYAPQGDIGKHKDGSIARACDWNGDSHAFVSSLVESGWLDESAAHRLVIHDWSEHCEQWVKLKLQKLKLSFVDEYRGQLPQGSIEIDEKSIAEPSAEATAVQSVEQTAELSASRDLAKPSLAKDSPNPNPNVAKDYKEGESPQPPPRTNFDCKHIESELVVFWNSSMQQNCQMTEKRRKALALRLKTKGWLENWRSAIGKAAVSDFCLGVNDRGWIADLEWFLKPDSVAKLMEGKYDNRSIKAPKTFREIQEDNTTRAIEEFVNGT